MASATKELSITVVPAGPQGNGECKEVNDEAKPDDETLKQNATVSE